MATVFVYNNNTGQVERYERGLSEPMPYNYANTLTVGEFRARSCSTVLWTDRRTMEAWNVTRSAFGAPISVGASFRRIWEDGHSGQSQHYAGTALDVGQTLSAAERSRLRQVAANRGVWTYIEPASLTPTWVHLDARQTPPACAAGGYPVVRQGAKGVYVFVLQDALNALGYSTAGLDGVFGSGTYSAVQRFQRTVGLTADGIVGCNTWNALTQRAVGVGQTATVVYKC